MIIRCSLTTFALSKRTNFCALCLLCGLSVLTRLGSGEPGFGEPEQAAGVVQGVWTTLADLTEEVRGSLGRLAGEQTVLSVQKAFSQVLDVLCRGLASGLNVLSDNISQLLQTAGLEVPISRVTPEGVVFVCQWVLLALIGYWLLSLALRLVASTLRRALWLLKVGGALTLFGLILSDHSVGTETMGIRLAILLAVCVLLGVGPSGDGTEADKTAHLEEQVRILERRVREVERWRRTEE